MSCDRECEQGRKCDCSREGDRQLVIATAKLLTIIAIFVFVIISLLN